MQASLSSRFGEKFGLSRSGRASKVFTASRLPDARSTTLETTENAPRPITSQTSNLRSKSLGVPSASPTVLDSASKAAPRSPCSSVGGAAASKSQDPDATPRGRFWEWWDGILWSSLRWRLEPYSGASAVGRGGPKGWERLSRPRPPGFESKRARGAALRCEGVLGELPQSSDFHSARWGSQARRDGDGHASHFAAPELFFIFPLKRARPTSPRSVPDNGPARGRGGIQGPSEPAARPRRGARGRRGAPDSPTPR